ncbi:DUF3658 domain-containing protein [Paenibacillus sp. DMB20]|uniref:DUF3658 domain-containing protein n=1 Tax=Paenibacillus sp. DMB20 TaxID=1642570 RepID=UPI00069C11D6|nr:DUF3658 domain-containing protein [Paenibacillus sp. DMB20]
MASLPEDADVSVINATNALNSEAVQYSHTGEITHEKLRSLLGTEKSLTREDKKTLAEDWHRLVAEQGMLRIMENGKVQTVPEDTFDRSIIDAALELGAYKGKFLKSARIIGQVIGYAEQRVSDFFYRIPGQTTDKAGSVRL